MSGQHQTIWEILGIGPTREKRVIRHAYARKCRECHPEDHPEEFQLLHQAYEQALIYADKKETGSPAPQQSDELLENAREEEPEPEDARSAGGWDELLGNAREEEMESEDARSPGSWDEFLGEAREEEPESEGARSAGNWDGFLGEAREEDPEPENTRSVRNWDELLASGMEEDSAFPSSLAPLSWQQTDRTRFSSAAVTEAEELLEQMKGLEVFSRDNPPQEECDWQHLMESWDQLSDSRLFRQTGETHCYFQMLFGWLDEERGRLHIPTIIGLLRIYKIKGRIIGHPWKARRFERKIPELRRLTYEYMFYQSIWDRELFLEKFERYGEQNAKKAVEKPEKMGKGEDRAPEQVPKGGLLQWMSEHRLLWKLLCGVLILLIRYLIRMS